MRKGFFGRHSYIVMFLTVCLLTFSLALYSLMNIGVKRKEEQLAELSERYESIVQSNNELNYLLTEADENELFEQLARAHGYAFPDEKLYYDVTPGK